MAENYMTEHDLELGVQESARYAADCATSYTNSMTNATATAKTSNANAVSLDNGTSSIATAIEETKKMKTNSFWV